MATLHNIEIGSEIPENGSRFESPRRGAPKKGSDPFFRGIEVP
jgi:hypothetical protein